MAQPRWRASAGPEALIELRLDRMADATPEALAWAAQALGPHRIIVTCRSLTEGGGVGGAVLHQPRARDALLRTAVALGVAYVDVEVHTLGQDAAVRAAVGEPHAMGATRLVASYHALDHMPPVARLTALALDAQRLGAAALKIVVRPRDAAQELALMAWAHGPQPLPTLAIALGEGGLWSRLLVGRQRHPGPYTPVRLDEATGVAPGQPTWSAADDQYRAWRVGPNTQVFGLVGHPVGHSRSPALHAQAIAARQMDAIYLPFEVPGSLQQWLHLAAEALPLRGLSVTAPHKGAALGLAASLSDGARASAAVNTLVAVDGPSRRWHGDNTDAHAAAESLRAALRGVLAQRRVLILGTGGAARAVAFGLCQAGCQVAVWGRRAPAAAQLCAQLRPHLVGDGQLVPLTDEELDAALGHCEAVVHCTPVGMAGTGTEGGARLLSDRQLKRLPISAVLFDTVYAPAQTALMAAARACGLTVLGGLDMLQRQAEAQYQLFYGAAAAHPGAR